MAKAPFNIEVVAARVGEMVEAAVIKEFTEGIHLEGGQVGLIKQADIEYYMNRRPQLRARVNNMVLHLFDRPSGIAE